MSNDIEIFKEGLASKFNDFQEWLTIESNRRNLALSFTSSYWLGATAYMHSLESIDLVPSILLSLLFYLVPFVFPLNLAFGAGVVPGGPGHFSTQRDVYFEHYMGCIGLSVFGFVIPLISFSETAMFALAMVLGTAGSFYLLAKAARFFSTRFSSGPSDHAVRILCQKLEDPTETWTIVEKRKNKDFIYRSEQKNIEIIRHLNDFEVSEPCRIELTPKNQKQILKSIRVCENNVFSRQLGVLPFPSELKGYLEQD